MSNIKFIDELPEQSPRGKKGRWSRIAEQLQERPGQWAEIERCPASDAAQAQGLRARYYAAARRNGLECTTRRLGADLVAYMRVPAVS